MANLANVAAIVGLLLPLLIAVIQQLRWKASTRAAIAFVSCFLAALITTWIEGNLNTKDLVSSFFIVFTVAQVSYAQFWKKIGVTKAIESKTPPQEVKEV